MVLRKLPVPGRPTYLDNSRVRGPTTFTVGAGGAVWTFFSPSLWLWVVGGCDGAG